MKYLIDTNLIIRIITDDNAYKAQAAIAFLDKKSNTVISSLVIFEVFQVLSGRYLGYSKKEAAEKLLYFLEVINRVTYIEDLSLHLQACSLIIQTNLDYIDCYLGIKSRIENFTVVSFDNDFKKIKGITLVKP